MEKSLYPIIHYFEQDYIDMYDKTWIAIENVCKDHQRDENTKSHYMDYSSRTHITALEAVSSSLFLVYSNLNFNPMAMVDLFYKHQHKDGYIPNFIDKEKIEKTDAPDEQKKNDSSTSSSTKNTPESNTEVEFDPMTIPPPLFAWAEFNYFNKTDNRKRLKEVTPILDKFHQWIEKNCLDTSPIDDPEINSSPDSFSSSEKADGLGLFVAPVEINGFDNTVRKNVKYPIDFNCQMALSYYLMSQIATYVNQRSLIFKYTKAFYAIKSKINEFFWDPYEKFYFDLDKDRNYVPCKTLASYWSLLMGISSEEQFTAMYALLRNPDYFGTETPFASVAKSEKNFDDTKINASGAVSPFLSAMVIKGLEVYKRHEFARESAMRLLYSLHTRFAMGNKNTHNNFYDYYPIHDTETILEYGTHDPPSPNAMPLPTSNKSVFFSGLVTITLLIENIIGVDICLPKKMLHWVIPCLENMGIEKMRFKKNGISTIIELTKRGWEVRHASEKLYYFSIDVPELNKLNTLPIPSGKCSLLLEKI